MSTDAPETKRAMSKTNDSKLDRTEAGTSTQQPSTNLALMGEVVWLMAHSPLHKTWPMVSIFQWVMPAFAHRQFRLYRRHGKPIAYVAWARMTKKVEEAYVLNPRSLNPRTG